MGDFVIEAERCCDSEEIADVVRRAFAHHAEVADMVAAIRASPRYRPDLALVARASDQVVGFVMLSGTDLVDDGGGRREVLALTPLAVLPEYEGRGIGSELVRAALVEADHHGEPLVVLEGSPRFYGRLGFVFAPMHGIALDLPNWAPREAAQAFLLSNYDPRVRGRVDYSPAIAATTR